MAVPDNARLLRGFALKSGVLLGVSPSSDPTFDVEFARATSSGVYETIGRLTPKGSGVPVTFTDLLPMDNAIRMYKARAVKDGWLEGDYTTPVSGKPILLPEIAPNITPLTGQKLGAPLYISTGGGGIPFGTPANADAYTKTLRIAAADFMPGNETQPYSLSAGELGTNVATTVSNFFYAPVTLPYGSVVSRFGFLGYRGTTAAIVTISLDNHTTSGGIAGATLTQSGTSYVLSSTTIASPLTASSARSIFASLRLVNGVAALNNARIIWVDLTYTTPSLQASL